MPSVGTEALTTIVAGTGRPWRRVLAALPVVLVLGALTWRQCETWRDPRTMWSRVVAIAPDHAYGHKSLGDALQKAGDFDAAVAESEPGHSTARGTVGENVEGAQRLLLVLEPTGSELRLESGAEPVDYRRRRRRGDREEE